MDKGYVLVLRVDVYHNGIIFTTYIYVTSSLQSILNLITIIAFVYFESENCYLIPSIGQVFVKCVFVSGG